MSDSPSFIWDIISKSHGFSANDMLVILQQSYVKKAGFPPIPPTFDKIGVVTDISLAWWTPVKGFFDCLVYLLRGDEDCDTDLYCATGVGHQGAGNGINIIRSARE